MVAELANKLTQLKKTSRRQATMLTKRHEELLADYEQLCAENEALQDSLKGSQEQLALTSKEVVS